MMSAGDKNMLNKLLGLKLWAGVSAIVAFIGLAASYCSPDDKDEIQSKQVIYEGSNNTQINGNENKIYK